MKTFVKIGAFAIGARVLIGIGWVKGVYDTAIAYGDSDDTERTEMNERMIKITNCRDEIRNLFKHEKV